MSILFAGLVLLKCDHIYLKEKVAVRPYAASSCVKSKASFRRVMLLFGTRPEAVKMAPVILEIFKSPTMKPIVVSTGQHKEMLLQTLRDFGLQETLDYDLGLMEPRQSLADLSSRAIATVTKIITLECPDIVLVQGDTTTAFMAALAAFYSKIPIGHIEAGLRTHNKYSPFPEEVNRQSISTMATYHFVPTRYAASNLYREGRYENVYVTGNTVVDALYSLKNKGPSTELNEHLGRVNARAIAHPQRMLLLTTHRRENFGKPLIDILTAISSLLLQHEDISVMFPIHLNPEVSTAVESYFGKYDYEQLKACRAFDKSSNREHLNRFFLLSPLQHSDLLGLIDLSYFVMTDSGGIQEEAITLGKPVLVLRESTERPEGIIAGASKLVGSNTSLIINWAQTLLQDGSTYDRMCNSKHLFGDGHAAEKIVRILEHTCDGQDGSPHIAPLLAGKAKQTRLRIYDLVVVLTIWKRKTLEEIIRMVQQQTALPGQQVAVILFQNGEHVNISTSVERWSRKESWSGCSVDVIHVANIIETGYYGRFLSPLLVTASDDAKFIILDDDILFGRRYFENMFRVVENGSLATRNGRFLGEGMREFDWREYWSEGDVDSFNIDDEYDFGGHIWAGNIAWLRTAWHYPPPLLYNAEDFWISAVLKRELGVATKRPRCPAPDAMGDVELCACSMKVANEHKAPKIGQNDINEQHHSRADAIRIIARHYDFKTVLSREVEAAKKMGERHSEIPLDQYNASKETTELFNNCLFWY